MTHRLRLAILLAAFALTFWPGARVSASLPMTIADADKGAIVYDENGNGQADLFGDTWVYDTNADGRAELLLRFRQEPALTAYLYDDANANGQVDYLASGESVQILEPYWRIKIVSRSGNWFLPNGAPDWNADMEVDSPYTLFGTDSNFSLGQLGTGQQDGIVDFTISCWDVNRDGVPDYEKNSLSVPPFEALIVNRNSHLRIPITRPFPWLDNVLVGWEKNRFTITHLIPTRTNEKGFFVYFGRPYHGENIFPGWENPFAFYDLADDADGFSELSVRLVSEYDVPKWSFLAPYNEVRYSWAQNENRLQYRLYLIGQTFIAASIPYPFYAVNHLPYEMIPEFVAETPWRGAIFGEDEQGGHGSIEGIYENLNFTVALRSRLLSSRLSVEIPPYLPNYLNVREEYTFSLKNKPRLYFSPIDRRLHLVGAQQGIILFDAALDPNNRNGFDFTTEELASGQAQRIRHLTYTDSDGDRYADTWTLYVYEQPVETLVFRRGMALLARGNTLSLKSLPPNLGPALWEAAPPATTEEWRALNERLQTDAAGRRALDDLAGLFADLPGENTVLTNTTLKEVSANPNELIAKIATTGLAAAARPAPFSFFAQAIPAGEYLLRGKEGAYWLEAPAPAMIALTPIVFLPNDSPVAGGRLLFSVVNRGAQDAQALLRLSEALSSGGSAVLYEADVRVPAYGQADFDLPWVPAWGGERQVRAIVTYTPAPQETPQTVSTETRIAIPARDSIARTLLLGFPTILAPLLLVLALLALLIPGAHTLWHEEVSA